MGRRMTKCLNGTPSMSSVISMKPCQLATLRSQRMAHPPSRAPLKERAGKLRNLVWGIFEYVCALGMSQPQHHNYR